MIESVSNDPLFEFNLDQVDVARWVDIEQPGTRAVRRQWRATQRRVAAPLVARTMIRSRARSARGPVLTCRDRGVPSLGSAWTTALGVSLYLIHDAQVLCRRNDDERGASPSTTSSPPPGSRISPAVRDDYEGPSVR